VIPQIRQRLCETFGEEYLQFLTLVCLPASTNAKNEARYEEFASRICEETGMENGYEHTHVVKDGMSKNHPANQTNHSIQPVIEFDKDFFKGKYVLLFDDIVTKGGTMLRYKDIMKSIGATVVGGMCLGKTKHERPGEKDFPLSDMTEEEMSQLLFGE
jgi:predicted amidophosphoribosyltransferase